MAKEKKKQENQEVEVRKIDISLAELIDEMKEIIIDFGWGQLRISDAEASRVLAKKIRESGLLDK